jgi:hypothetical protein
VGNPRQPRVAQACRLSPFGDNHFPGVMVNPMEDLNLSSVPALSPFQVIVIPEYPSDPITVVIHWIEPMRKTNKAPIVRSVAKTSPASSGRWAVIRAEVRPNDDRGRYHDRIEELRCVAGCATDPQNRLGGMSISLLDRSHSYYPLN